LNITAKIIEEDGFETVVTTKMTSKTTELKEVNNKHPEINSGFIRNFLKVLKNTPCRKEIVYSNFNTR
jgi:hypothetical protein